MTLFTVWCEWDIGNSDIAFTSIAKARAWCQENEILKGSLDDGMDSVQAVEDAGLLGFHKLEVDPS